MSGQIRQGQNTRRAAMDAERLSWECFRFEDDSRKGNHLAEQRRAYFVKAANSANQDGTHVEISVNTFTKAAGKRATAFRRLGELESMGVCLPEIHIDERGVERELLSRYQGTRLRRLRFEPLEKAQQLIDSGQEFEGHKRLTKIQQRSVQRAWLKELEVATEPSEKESQIDEKESQIAEKESQIACEGVSPRVIHNRSNHTEEPIPTIPLQKEAGGLAQIFGQVKGKPLPGGTSARNQKLVGDAMAIAPGRVMEFWKRWLDQRDLTDMKFPLSMFVNELPGLLGADSSSDREWTKEEHAAFRAQLDRQNEQKRADLEREFEERRQAEECALANADKWF